MSRRQVWRVRLTRDLVLFALGATILAHQAFVAATVQAELVAAAVALILGPGVARVDDAVKDRKTVEVKNDELDR